MTVLAAAQQKWTDAMISSSRRSELLWWRQSLYSPSMRRSYRDLQPAVAAIMMASDFAGLAGSCAPVSADYFLRETVAYVLGNNRAAARKELLEQFDAENEAKERFLATIPNLPARAGVKTIVEQIRDDVLSGNSAKPKEGAAKTAKSVQEDLTSLAVRVYAALQALREVAEKADGKKV